jgi:hypothetical protein
MFSAMEYRHWLMAAGAVLTMLGFVDLAFSRNKNGTPAEELTHEAEKARKL